MLAQIVTSEIQSLREIPSLCDVRIQCSAGGCRIRFSEGNGVLAEASVIASGGRSHTPTPGAAIVRPTWRQIA